MEDVEIAMAGGATQIILGTIFETECKKGVLGKGVEFVREICQKCPLPGIRYRRNESAKAASCHRRGSCRLLHDVWIYANNENIAIKCFHNMTCQLQ